MSYAYQDYNYFNKFAPSAPLIDEQYAPSAPPLYEDAVPAQKAPRQIDLSEDCAFCLDSMGQSPDGKKPTLIAETKCSHFFHNFCFQQFLQSEKNKGVDSSVPCPMCRTSLKDNNAYKVIHLNDAPAAVKPQVSIQILPPAKPSQPPVVKTAVEVDALGNALASGFSMLKSFGNYVGVSMLNLLSESPSLDNILAKWNSHHTHMESKMAEQNEEIEVLLTQLRSLPNSVYTQRALNQVDKSIKTFYDNMQREHKQFMKALAATNQQFIGSI